MESLQWWVLYSFYSFRVNYSFSKIDLTSINKPELLLLCLKKNLQTTYLSQLAEDNLEVLVIVHLIGEGVQVVFNGRGTEAAVELRYVVIEGERRIADGHLGDLPYSALIY